MFETILYEYFQDYQFAKITLNRPAKRNAVSLKMGGELYEILEDLSHNPELKFLVLTGAGDRSFCSGGDLHDFHGEMDKKEAYQKLSRMKGVLYKLATLPVPTICLLNGDTRGGGCELATACDFRFAKPDTSHGFIQGKLGITPGWGGGVLLHKRMDSLKAYQWLLNSNMIDAQQLFDWGWIQQFYSDEQALWSIFQPLIEKERIPLTYFKQQYLNQNSFSQIEEKMDKEVERCAHLWVSDEHKKAVEAFFRRTGKK
ncbi:Enoyl-CoA hydratase/carnithine racemase [Salinibacillus kushneri]|uniref:Enoyl-CoA hydratase/carnithine racemase n=1 Tax=Salinibacillus kushneri TaxID=237682 RepID=A0A1I0HP28_9BACI|nr:enoyl-CoA hydratase/isomerase family protein [Salinibacillus kushneri]SET85718.1 Enoyl-CoA hydratase/carnithine racemase [Salinibacillus kushneri]